MLDRDRGKKQVNYARGGIPVYWIVNLIDRQFELFGDPSPDGYQASQILKPGQDVPVVIEAVERGRIAVAGILP
jgi:Uma2 family endonuclease